MAQQKLYTKEMFLIAAEKCEVSMIDAKHIMKYIDEYVTPIELPNIDENTSDGYHTFKELYEFRKVYNAALFNEWGKQGKYGVHKSQRHYDGEQCFGGGWFIVVANLPSGQISNHYEMKDWDLFDIPYFSKAKYEFDGHTPKDVIKRLIRLTLNK